MKKFIVYLLVFSLGLSPIFSAGKGELNLRTILLKDSKEVTNQLNEKPTVPTQAVKKLESNSKELTASQESLDLEKMTDREIINEIVTTAQEGTNINQGLLRSVALIQAETNRQALEIEDLIDYTSGLETDLKQASKAAQEKEVKLTEAKAEVDVLKEKLKAKKSYKTLLVGADYSLKDGYALGLDFGVKFDNGLTTQIGVKAPLAKFNPIGLVDVNSYTFSTKFGWSW